jgi:uncharacterized protein
MKIHVSRVPFEGLQQTAQCDPRALDLERLDLRIMQPVTINASIMKAEHELVVQAEMHGELEVDCGRCLLTFTMPLQTRGIFTYEVGPTDVVDITDDVRQEIMLAYPMIPVCTPQCKGLCRRCGQNLNEQPCACPEQAGSSESEGEHGTTET